MWLLWLAEEKNELSDSHTQQRVYLVWLVAAQGLELVCVFRCDAEAVLAVLVNSREQS